MKIALVSDSGVNKHATYGMDQRLGWLVDGLNKAGHQIEVFAMPNSASQAKKMYQPSVPGECLLPMNVAKVLERSDEFDIIHSNALIFLQFSKLSKKPVVHTVAWADYSPERLNVYYHYKNIGYIAQTKFSLRHYPKINWLGVAHNGISTENLKPGNQPRKFLFWLGRIHPEKQPHLAIAASKKTNLPLILAGQVQDEEYFKQKIKPHLSKNIKYLGEVDYKQKIKLYQQAIAFLTPVKLNETCSNAVLEAQSCGTPVVAFDRGSMSEIIKHGKTGFVVKNVNEMVKAIKQIDKIKEADCRAWIIKDFSVQTMTAAYIKLYQKKIKSKK